MNIVLIGMRGSGKTTVGKTLAKKLNRELIETDELIVTKVGMNIQAIVKKQGWERFRDRESEIVREVTILDNVVIATGGGVVTQANNVATLKKNGKLIFLEARTDTLLRRIGNDAQRPALTDKKSKKEELEHIWQERESLYRAASDITIKTDHLTPNEVAEMIVKYAAT